MPVAYRSRWLGVLLIAATLPFVSPALANDVAPFKMFAAGDAAAWPLGWSTEAYLYTGSRTTSTTDQNSSAHVDMTGGIGVLQYNFPWLSLAVLGNVGHTHITYLQVLQDTYASSDALGLRASANLGLLSLTVGASAAHDAYQTILQNGANSWDGAEREIHGTLSSRIRLGGPLWLAPLGGFRYLALSQDAHMLGTSIIPHETDPSKLAYAGTKAELEIRDELNNVLTPWIFGGVTHEFANQAPLGPSVFFTEQIAGNEYTLFPQGTTGVPAVFPDHTTGVFGLGVNLEFQKVLTIDGAFYREFNSDYDFYNYKLGAVLRW